MIHNLEIKLVYRTPHNPSFYSARYLYYCEVVFEGDRYTVQINKYQYNLIYDCLDSNLDFLIIKNWFFGYKLYALNT